MMLASHLTPETVRQIEQHPWIATSVIIILFILGWMAKR